MSRAVVLAFAAGGCGVLAAWETLALVQGPAAGAALRRLLAPLGGAPGPVDDALAAGERRRLLLVATATLAGAGWLTAGPVAALLCAATAPFGLGRLAALRRERRRRALRDGAPAVARALGDALGAGRSIRGALEEVGHAGGTGPVTDAELAGVAAALRLGERTETVTERLRARAASPAWDTILAAILLQREAGGDLAGLLRAIAADLEEARRVEADARIATAQARFTARLVAALPLCAALLAELAHPGTVLSILRQPLSALLVGAALVLEAVALLIVRRIAGAQESV